MNNTHCSTCIMARKLKNLQNETQTLYDLECGRKLNNVENETRKMYVLENWRNTEKRAN